LPEPCCWVQFVCFWFLLLAQGSCAVWKS
jgi:hypothetical protein